MLACGGGTRSTAAAPPTDADGGTDDGAAFADAGIEAAVEAILEGGVEELLDAIAAGHILT